METLYDQMESIIVDIKAHEQRFGDELYTYIDKVYGFLNKIQAGKTYTVSRIASVENIELFTSIVKLYICEDKTNTVSFLRNDFNQFRRNRTITAAP